MTKEEISKLITDQLGQIAKDVQANPPETEETPEATETVEKNVQAESTEKETQAQPLTLEALADVLAPKLMEKMNVAPEKSEPVEKSKVSEAVKDALKKVGITDDDIDVDLVVKRKRKGTVTEEDDDGDVIFTSKAQAEEEPENDLPTNISSSELDKELAQLSKEDLKKALGIWVHGAISQ
ncbi:MAG: hypothetical protein ACXAC7_08025 [Candidatus Hodarchaeales archaeon]|jgi:hypothetical protein